MCVSNYYQACTLLLLLLKKLEKADAKDEETALWDNMVVQDTTSKVRLVAGLEKVHDRATAGRRHILKSGIKMEALLRFH